MHIVNRSRDGRSAISKTLSLIVVALIVISSGSLYVIYNRCCTTSQGKGTVYVLYAGSLVNTMEKSIGPAFQTTIGYTYEGEGHGSLQDAQMIINNERSPDVFISVGTSAMRLLANQSRLLTTWWYTFATDQLVIAYSNRSSFASQLDEASKNQTAWYRVLEEPGLRFGVSDPTLDPKGVYAILLFKLASIYYNDTSLGQYLNSTHTQTFAEETMTAELQTGAVDAMVAYKHEAIEQHFAYISLPSKVNFGVPSDSQYYSQVSVYVSGKKNVGAPVIFVATIPAVGKDRTGALAFLKFILTDAKARTLLISHGLAPVEPPIVGGNASAAPQF